MTPNLILILAISKLNYLLNSIKKINKRDHIIWPCNVRDRESNLNIKKKYPLLANSQHNQFFNNNKINNNFSQGKFKELNLINN